MSKRVQPKPAAHHKLTYIAQTLHALAVPIDSVSCDPANARLHDDANLAAIAASLRRFGQQKPIVASERGVILAGNGTWTAAKALGWEFIAVARSTLTDTEAAAFAIADNRAGELASWDWQALASTLKGFDADTLSHLGFTPEELEPLLAAEWTPPPIDESHVDESSHAVKFTASQWEKLQRAAPPGTNDYAAWILDRVRA